MRLKNFNQFINESNEQERGAFGEILDPKLERKDLHDLMVSNYDAFEQECNKIAAKAIGCRPEDIVFLGTPEEIEDDDQEKVEGLLVNGKFDPENPGKLLWWFSVPAPDGYMAAYLFKHDGKDIVMYDAEDGPFIYSRS
jgi:hypothetical protein